MVRDQEHADVRDAHAAHADRVLRAAQRELPVVAHDGVDADARAEGDRARAAAVDKSGALRGIELRLVGARSAAACA